MFSTMITEESTMIPKSTAPIESRLADLPRTKSTDKANNRASGTLMATISAVRTLLRNMQQHHRHQAHAGQQVLPHRVGRDADQFGAVVIGLDLHARQQAAGVLVELLNQGVDVVQGGQRLIALAQQHDALDDFVVILPDAPALGIEHVAALVIDERDAPHHMSEAGLVAHHHALPPDRVACTQRPAFDHVVDRAPARCSWR